MSDYKEVNKAFSSISKEYDTEETFLHKQYRLQIRNNLNKYIKPTMNVLEINAGTGIDALYLLQNYDITLTTIDISDTMIEYMKRKREEFNLQDRWQIYQISFTELSILFNQHFDIVFSNFGGLNCLNNLSKFTQDLHLILNKNAVISMVIMPKICLWEIKDFLKGNWKFATRRWSGKTMAKINNNPFEVYYYNYFQIIQNFSKSYNPIGVQSIAPFSPIADINNLSFVRKYPTIFKQLIKLDSLLNKKFPFNRMGDYLIVDLKYNP